ncbi:hypothetical protein ScalyP_jg9033, partial [Parmales sp. scaly parma]
DRGGGFRSIETSSNSNNNEEEEGDRNKYFKGQVGLHALFEEEDIFSRPHFAKSIQQLAKRIGHKKRGLIDLDTLFAAIFPYMKRSELLESLEFVQLPDIVTMSDWRRGAEGAEEMNKITNEKLEQLQELFELYDADGNGTVSVEEIKSALLANKELYNQSKAKMGGRTSPTMFEDGAMDDGDMDRIIAEVDDNGNGELDFEEFCKMFKDLF